MQSTILGAERYSLRDASILLMMSLMGPDASCKLVAMNDDQLRDAMLHIAGFIRAEMRAREMPIYVEH